MKDMCFVCKSTDMNRAVVFDDTTVIVDDRSKPIEKQKVKVTHFKNETCCIACYHKYRRNNLP